MMPECGLNENQAYSIILGENLLTLQIAGPGGKTRAAERRIFKTYQYVQNTHVRGTPH